jgi:VanZ family protein
MKSGLLRAWLPALAFVCLFAAESTRFLGSDHTSAPLHAVAHALVGSTADHNWGELHHLIRKTGHFLGYGVLSLVFYRGFRLTVRRRSDRLTLPLHHHALAIFATFLIASADEIHQTFLPNRSGKLSDVLLDTAGAVALQILIFLALRTLARRNGARGGVTLEAKLASSRPAHAAVQL